MGAATTDESGVILTCQHCGQRNRTPYGKLGESGVCGRCKSELPPPTTSIEIAHEAHFEHLIKVSLLPVVVDFWAPWCRPCLQVAPEFEKVAAANTGKYVIAKVNTEALPGLGGRFDVRAIPTMIVFIGGQEKGRSSGARPAPAIEDFVRQVIEK